MTRAFDIPGYYEILDAIQGGGYRFVSYRDTRAAGRICLLRHDIDANPDAALEMACLEAERGVTATYFAMVRSPFYNLISCSTDRIICKIVERFGDAFVINCRGGLLLLDEYEFEDRRTG